MLMLFSITLLLMQGHCGSAETNHQRWIIFAIKQAISIKLTTTVGPYSLTYPWLWKHIYGLTILFTIQIISICITVIFHERIITVRACCHHIFLFFWGGGGGGEGSLEGNWFCNPFLLPLPISSSRFSSGRWLVSEGHEIVNNRLDDGIHLCAC